MHCNNTVKAIADRFDKVLAVWVSYKHPRERQSI